MNWFNLVTSGATRRDVVGEKENLAEKEPQKLKELSAAWNKWNSQMVDPAWGPPPGAAVNRAGKRNNRAN